MRGGKSCNPENWVMIGIYLTQRYITIYIPP